jgi:hypothetical protein
MAFVREAAFKEQDNPNSLELEEHFKVRSVLQPVVVTCINAAKHLETQRSTRLWPKPLGVQAFLSPNLSLTLPRIHFL